VGTPLLNHHHFIEEFPTFAAFSKTDDICPTSYAEKSKSQWGKLIGGFNPLEKYFV